MRSIMRIAAIASTLLITGPPAVLAQADSIDARETLARELPGAWLPLEGGFVVGADQGAPVSGKYEIEDGALQLSVYTSKADPSSGDAFMEVIVDYSSGVILKVAAITDGEDLAAARAERAAMDQAKHSLAEATAVAVKANAGYRAVSTTPRVENGHPIAEVTLVRHDDWKVVNEPLD